MPRLASERTRPALSKTACTASRARAWSSVKSSSARVGSPAPERPSPTRAGVSARKSPIGRCGGFISLGRDGSLAQPDRIVRCALPAASGRARKLDQVVGDHRRADQPLDVALAKAAERELPENPLVIAEHTDLPEDVAQHDQAPADIRPAPELVGHRHLDAPGVGVVALILVACEKLLGLVGSFHAAAS